MDHQTLYANILRDVTFISLIFDQKHVGRDEIVSIKTRINELSDKTQNLAFKHIPHVLREQALAEIYQLGQSWRSIETGLDFEEQRNELEKRTKAFLSDLQNQQLKAA